MELCGLCGVPCERPLFCFHRGCTKCAPTCSICGTALCSRCTTTCDGCETRACGAYRAPKHAPAPLSGKSEKALQRRKEKEKEYSTACGAYQPSRKETEKETEKERTLREDFEAESELLEAMALSKKTFTSEDQTNKLIRRLQQFRTPHLSPEEMTSEEMAAFDLAIQRSLTKEEPEAKRTQELGMEEMTSEEMSAMDLAMQASLLEQQYLAEQERIMTRYAKDFSRVLATGTTVKTKDAESEQAWNEEWEKEVPRGLVGKQEEEE